MTTVQVGTVSVLIPIRNASQWLPRQLEALLAQKAEKAEIVIIDSEPDDATCESVSREPLCRLMPVQQTDFDHGATLEEAARSCQSTYPWFWAEDAIPTDPWCLEELLKDLQGENIACVFARQRATQEAGCIEQFNRELNNPNWSFVHDADIHPLQSVLRFALICVARLLGESAGHNGWCLSERTILRKSQNPYF